jgi:hypothetical protein
MKLRIAAAPRILLRAATLWVTIVLVVAGCGEGDPSTALISSAADDPTSDSTTAPTDAATDGGTADNAGESGAPAPLLVFADTVGEYCSGTGDSIVEMAFGATVVDQMTRTTSTGRDVSWAVFAVDTWYTDDLGPEIGLWAQDFTGQVGERWLIAASRYSVDDKAGGDVFWCESAPETEELAAEWSGRYGGEVAAGNTATEAAGSPETLDRIATAKAKWETTAPPSYTFTTSTGSRDTDGSACGAGAVRVVVADGAVVQARDVFRHCDVSLDDVADINQLFDLAADAAGAVEGDIGFDPTYGFITSFFASDRSVERWIDVTAFTPGAFPLTTGGVEALNDARVQWQESGITSYTATVDVRCFCDVQGPIEVTVEQGLVTAVSVEASEVYPLRVEEMFNAIEPLMAGDHVELAFHPQLGYPVTAILDPSPADDDEIEYAITDFAPLP